MVLNAYFILFSILLIIQLPAYNVKHISLMKYYYPPRKFQCYNHAKILHNYFNF